MNKNAQLLCLWTGPLMVLTWVLGFVVLAGYIPPLGPGASATEIAAFYQRNTAMIRLGTFFCIISTTFIASWGIGVAVRMKVIEGERPVLFYVLLAMAIVSAVESILGPVFWQLASFRPAETTPEVVQAFNDMGWFLFLVTWPSFWVWYIATAVLIFKDKRAQPEFPRWLGYFCLWAAVMQPAAGFIIFFKSGPFAWDGIFAFYIPMFIFLIWMLALTIYGIKGARRDTA